MEEGRGNIMSPGEGEGAIITLFSGVYVQNICSFCSPKKGFSVSFPPTN